MTTTRGSTAKPRSTGGNRKYMASSWISWALYPREASWAQPVVAFDLAEAVETGCTVRKMLMLVDREEISRGLAESLEYKEIGLRLGRDSSVISREVARHGGRERYRAAAAHEAACACRVPELGHELWPAVSGCGFILVDQAAEDRSTPDPAVDGLGDRRLRTRRT